MAISYPNKAKKLRERLLSQVVPPPTPVEIDGEWFHIRTPTVEDRDRIFKRGSIPRPPKSAAAAKAKRTGIGSGAFNDEGMAFDSENPMASVSGARTMAQALILLACDDVGEPVFEDADFDTLTHAAVGSWVERLGKACMERLSPEEKTEGEDSGATQDGASSSSSRSA